MGTFVSTLLTQAGRGYKYEHYYDSGSDDSSDSGRSDMTTILQENYSNDLENQIDIRIYIPPSKP